LRERALGARAAGKTLDRYGAPLLIKLTGDVEVWFKDKAE